MAATGDDAGLNAVHLCNLQGPPDSWLGLCCNLQSQLCYQALAQFLCVDEWESVGWCSYLAAVLSL